MAVQIPTIEDLTEQIVNDIATSFNKDAADIGDTYRVWAKVQAGKLYQLYLGANLVQKNVFPDLADLETLIRYGEIIIGRAPEPAGAGSYSVRVNGEIGAVIAASTQFVADDNTDAAGFLYVLDAEVTLAATAENITLRALEAGTESRLIELDTVSSLSPIADVESQGTVISITTEPTAGETTEDYRSDVIDGMQLEPQGGSPSDWRLWCADVAEIRKVYPYLKPTSPNDVIIYVEVTAANTAPGQPDGVPTQAVLDEVYTPPAGVTPESGVVVFNPATGRGRRPVPVLNIEALPVEPITVDLYFTDLSDESYAEQIKAAVTSLLHDVRPFVAGAQSVLTKNDNLTIGLVIAEVINLLAGTGVTFTTISMEVGGVAVDSYLFLLGEYPYLQDVYNNGSPI